MDMFDRRCQRADGRLKKHRSRRNAEKAAQAAADETGKPMAYYECPVCEFWHIGHAAATPDAAARHRAETRMWRVYPAVSVATDAPLVPKFPPPGLAS